MNTRLPEFSEASTILIVDDTPANVAVLADYLEDQGLRIVVAQDGQEGLSRAAFVKPDLILLDVLMPGMDGYTAVARLRGQPDTATIPIIMLTGCTDPAYGQLSEGMGASAHVTKPFSPLLLGELAQEMVRRSRV